MGRARVPSPPRSGAGKPLVTVNIPPLFAAPIDAGLCTLAQLKQRDPLTGEPLLDLGDVCDANEVLAIRAINEDRAMRAAQKAAGKGKRPGTR